MTRGALLLVLLALAGCGGRQRDEALQRLSAASPRERASAVAALAGTAAPADDEAWTALARAARDGSAQVRAAAASALAGSARDEAVDAAGGLLRDPDDAVRVAAAQAFGAHCGDRGRAYLRLSFARSDARVRAAIAGALARCGVPLEQMLARDEAERRLLGRKLLAAQGAQRARGALLLGRLGRDEDVAALLPLLDDADGAVVAAAAQALGEAGAQVAAPRLIRLLAEPGDIAGAAAEALAEIGAVAPARAPLLQVAVRASGEAEAAAAAAGPDCDAALRAQWARAAALLARDCPAAPLVRRLAAAVAALKPAGTGRAETSAIGVALEAVLAARGPAPEAAAPLSKLLALPEPDTRACRAAEALHAAGAGPALVALVKRERAAIEVERAQAPVRRDDDDAAAEVSAQAARAQTPAREKYDLLMAKLAKHQGAAEVRASAQDQLAALLRGGADAAAERRAVLIAALHAARALRAPGAEEEARILSSDPDRRIAAAARGEQPDAPAPATPVTPAAAAPAAAAPAPAAPAPATPATAAAAPAAAAPAAAAPDAAALRAQLWSDDGRDRAAACAALAAQHDEPSAPVRRALAADPERRVRAACATANETTRPKKG